MSDTDFDSEMKVLDEKINSKIIELDEKINNIKQFININIFNIDIFNDEIKNINEINNEINKEIEKIKSTNKNLPSHQVHQKYNHL